MQFAQTFQYLHSPSSCFSPTQKWSEFYSYFLLSTNSECMYMKVFRQTLPVMHTWWRAFHSGWSTPSYAFIYFNTHRSRTQNDTIRIDCTYLWQTPHQVFEMMNSIVYQYAIWQTACLSVRLSVESDCQTFTEYSWGIGICVYEHSHNAYAISMGNIYYSICKQNCCTVLSLCNAQMKAQREIKEIGNVGNSWDPALNQPQHLQDITEHSIVSIFINGCYWECLPQH